jgi:hypothetical protein
MTVDGLLERLQRLSDRGHGTTLVVGLQPACKMPPFQVLGVNLETHLDADGSHTVWLILEEM